MDRQRTNQPETKISIVSTMTRRDDAPPAIAITSTTSTITSSGSTMDTIHRFLLLPSHVPLILLLEFLNSFRSFGMRFILYNYLTNEFVDVTTNANISDSHAGYILGIKSLLDIAFGLLGSIFVDIYGVRRVSLVALCVALVGRTLLALARSTNTLYLALYLFSPCGDALLSVGLYRVALKKLSTPLTRPLTFALSSSVSNMAGVCVALVVDSMRRNLEDVHVDLSGRGGEFWNWADGIVGGVYTPVRQFIVFTWLVLLFTLVLAYTSLKDVTVIDLDDLDDEYLSITDDRKRRKVMKKKNSDIDDDDDDDECDDDPAEKVNGCHTTFDAVDGDVGNDGHQTKTQLVTPIPSDYFPVEPMVGRCMLKRLFPTSYYQSICREGEGYDEKNYIKTDSEKLTINESLSRLPPEYKMFNTQYRNTTCGGEGISVLFSPCTGFMTVLKQFIFIIRMRNTWKVLIFSFASVPVVLQWTANEMVLPPFLERHFGESIPIYTIQSIHMIGCLMLPPFAQAFTSSLEDFRVVMPGLWIMAISPLFVAMLPNVLGSCIWQVFMTLGQVLWTPRQDSWTAGLAPTGMEGLFFAVGSSRALLAPLGDLAMGIMNERYNPNCPECRDSFGHYCEHLVVGGDDGDVFQCSSVQENCSIFLDNREETCPTTCTECPYWEPINPSTFWYMLAVISILSPLLAWIFLPFLRGKRNRADRCYGICTISVNRYLGVCGAPEDKTSCQVYGFVDDESDIEAKKYGRSIC